MKMNALPLILPEFQVQHLLIHLLPAQIKGIGEMGAIIGCFVLNSPCSLPPPSKQCRILVFDVEGGPQKFVNDRIQAADQGRTAYP